MLALSLESFSSLGATLHVGGSICIVFGQTVVKVAHCIAETSGVGTSWVIPSKHPSPLWYVLHRAGLFQFWKGDLHHPPHDAGVGLTANGAGSGQALNGTQRLAGDCLP